MANKGRRSSQTFPQFAGQDGSKNIYYYSLSNKIAMVPS